MLLSARAEDQTPEPTVPSPRPDASAQSLRLGVTLTAVLSVAYFGFIGLSAFAPAILGSAALAA